MRARILSLFVLAGAAHASTYNLDEVKAPLGLSDEDLGKLTAAGVKTTADLYSTLTDRKKMKALKKAKLDKKKVKTWTAYVDLMRIDGIGPDVAGLLQAVGVPSVKKLAKAKAADLSAKIEKVNAKKKLTENTPSAEHLSAWIEAAAKL